MTPARTHTGLFGRALAVTGAGLMALTASVAMAPTAGADDLERSSAEAVAAIEAKPWPAYSQGDVDIDIRAAQRTLAQNGYDSEEETSEFTEELEKQLLAYQAGYRQFLPQSGELDDETWLLLREQTYGDEYVPGDGPNNDRTWGVLGIQELLMYKHDAGINNDGWYGQETFYAVCDAQEAYGLEADGLVGGVTWRALITDQDWDQDSARELPEAQLSERAPEGFVTDAEAAAAQYSCDDRTA